MYMLCLFRSGPRIRTIFALTLCLILLGLPSARAEMTEEDQDFLQQSEACNPRSGIHCLKGDRNAPAPTLQSQPALASPRKYNDWIKFGDFYRALCSGDSSPQICQILDTAGHKMEDENVPESATEVRLGELAQRYLAQCQQRPTTAACRNILDQAARAAFDVVYGTEQRKSGPSQKDGNLRYQAPSGRGDTPELVCGEYPDAKQVIAGPTWGTAKTTHQSEIIPCEPRVIEFQGSSKGASKRK